MYLIVVVHGSVIGANVRTLDPNRSHCITLEILMHLGGPIPILEHKDLLQVRIGWMLK